MTHLSSPSYLYLGIYCNYKSMCHLSIFLQSSSLCLQFVDAGSGLITLTLRPGEIKGNEDGNQSLSIRALHHIADSLWNKGRQTRKTVEERGRERRLKSGCFWWNGGMKENNKFEWRGWWVVGHVWAEQNCWKLVKFNCEHRTKLMHQKHFNPVFLVIKVLSPSYRENSHSDFCLIGTISTLSTDGGKD